MPARFMTNTIACLLLTLMFGLMFFSAWNETAIMDELAHIPAGYSYLTQKDYRLNPEHPPLAKDIAAFPLLFAHLNFPAQSTYWQNDINGQWAFGSVFLYESGNNPDTILRLSRLPIMLLTILLGWLLFRWSRNRYGNSVGLLTLFFFATSPTFIAHGRYVTTDVAAAFGFFIGFATFIKFLEHDASDGKFTPLNPRVAVAPLAYLTGPAKYLAIAGLAFGVAQLLKFSLVLLAPFYFLLGAIWAFAQNYEQIKFMFSWREKARHILKAECKIFGKIILIGLIGLAVIWIFYAYHVWNYPSARQISDTTSILQSFGFRPLPELVLWMDNHALIRPLGEYFLGVLMVMQRAAGGNTAYFLGEVSSNAWWYYFPVTYLFKEQLGLHLLALISILLAGVYIYKSRAKSFDSFVEWICDNFTLATAGIFIIVYFAYSMRSNLNIGVRHILPTFPFIYLLVSREIVKWVKYVSIADPKNFMEWMKSLYEKYIASAPKYILVGIIVFWMFLEAVLAFPYYLSYFNELGGGPMNGYKYVVDSNYDWGQDLKRLRDFTEDSGIKKIRLDYFGGGSPAYYLNGVFEPWQSSKGEPYYGDWFAVSATNLESAQGLPIKGFVKSPADSYGWLKDKTPIARAGTSIFIYKF